MPVVVLPAVGTVQVPPVWPWRRIASRDGNVAAAGTGDQEHLRMFLSLCRNRFRICRRICHGNYASTTAGPRLRLFYDNNFSRNLSAFVGASSSYYSVDNS